MAAKGSGNNVCGSSKTMKVLPLSCLNHISRRCSNLSAAENFYENLLGFVQIKRPGSFDFNGAWLFNYGIGIHLLQADHLNVSQDREIDPKSDHISFQCEDITAVETKLKESNIKYIRRVVEEAGILVDQVFFHDPDGFMIEICNCDQLPVVPLNTCSASIISQQPVFASCKRTNSHSTLIPKSVPDCASQNILQSGNQVGNQEYAIYG